MSRTRDEHRVTVRLPAADYQEFIRKTGGRVEIAPYLRRMFWMLTKALPEPEEVSR
jgi:hypothetical protein